MFRFAVWCLQLMVLGLLLTLVWVLAKALQAVT